MESSLQVVIDEKRIAKENAALLLEAYGAPFTEAGKILATYDKIKVTDESQTDLMQEAREKRLALKKIRTGVENKRKELKENINAQAQAIDGVAHYIKETIEPAEQYLELQEKFAEIKAAERAAKLKADRLEKLSQYTDDTSLYNFEAMSDEQFDSLLATLKAQKEAEAAAAKKAEEDRKATEEAERKRQEEIEAENTRLKAEAKAKEELERKRIHERSEQLKEIGMPVNEVVFGFRISGLDLAGEDDEYWNNLLAEAKRRIQMDKDQKAADAKAEEKRQAELAAERQKAEEEREKREALEAEQRAKDEEEARKKREAEEAERQALLAPDKEKIIAFANALTLVRTQKIPAVKTKQAQDVLSLVDKELASLSERILNAAKHL